MGLLDGVLDTPNKQALWALGSGLLGVRRGNEGRAFQQALSAYNEAEQSQRRNKLTDVEVRMREAQLQNLLQQQGRDPEMFGKIDPSDFTTESLAKFQATRNYGDLVLNPRNSKAPSPVLEWEHFNSLSPEQREQYLTMKRAAGNVMIGQVPHQVIGSSVKPLSTLPQEVGARAAVADATSAGRVAGEVRTQAQADLPAAAAMVPVLKDRVKQLLDHPGRDYATGWKSLAPPIPGTAQYDFISRHNELRSKAFEQAFQTLKGGGPITEMEGKAATDALIRMDRATSAKEYEAAANDFLKAYEAGVKKIEGKTNFTARPQMPSGYMGAQEQARGVRDLGITERVDRVPDADPLGIR